MLLERDAVEADSTGALLRYVYADGQMVNRALLEGGHATVSEFPADFRHRGSFVSVAAAGLAPDGHESRPPTGGHEIAQAPAPQTSYGTLPPPDIHSGTGICDFSGSVEPVVKGNVESRTRDRVYHVPGGLFYSTTVVETEKGDRWLCTEREAIAAGWKRSKR